MLAKLLTNKYPNSLKSYDLDSMFRGRWVNLRWRNKFRPAAHSWGHAADVVKVMSASRHFPTLDTHSNDIIKPSITKAPIYPTTLYRFFWLLHVSLVYTKMPHKGVRHAQRFLKLLDRYQNDVSWTWAERPWASKDMWFYEQPIPTLP